MIFEAITIALKLLAAYVVLKRFLIPCYVQFKYARRGVTFFSSIPKPFIGDTLEFGKRVSERPDRAHLYDIC